MLPEAGEARGMGHGGCRPFRPGNAYRHYVVWLLFAVYVCNFVDRQILSIVMESIKIEFSLRDWQLGLLSGLAFAAFYTSFGIPIARLADRRNRVSIISASIVIWSAFTALSGLARNFWHLLIARIGVGIGEAGCSPPAYSIISDYFEPGRRATALSIYSMGVYGGGALGFLVGGHVAQEYGWRVAFFAAGLPGLAVALLVKLTLREPPRGHSEPAATREQSEAPPFAMVLRHLWAKPAFRHMSFGAGLHAFVAYGVNTFYSPFFIRAHGMSLAELSSWLALVVALGGVAGTFLGGALCDRKFARSGDTRWYLWIPAFTMLLNVPAGLLAYSVHDRHLALAFLMLFIGLNAAYLGPTIASTHRMVGLRERALAGAVLLLILNIIGLGLGPMVTGAVSDLANTWLAARGTGPDEALAEGLRWALRLTICIDIWAAYHYAAAARTLRADVTAASAIA
jgi:MFS family permease